MKRLVYCLLATTLVAGLLVGCAPKPVEAPYYEGKTITMVVSSAPGGGTDTTGRIIASFLPQYIPGNPTIVVSNNPGGGGSVANNIFYETAAPDGLTLLQTASSTVQLQIRSPEVVKYDITKYRPIGNICRSGSSILMIRKEALPRLTDPNAEPVVCGSKAGEETWQSMLMWGREFLGWNVRWILGYGGDAELALAFERGENDITATENRATINNIISGGTAVALCQTGVYRGGEFARRSDFPDVPTFEETLGDKKPTGLPWEAFLVWIAPSMVDKFLSAPPNTPDEYVSILRNAFAEVCKDPKFIEEMKNIVSEEYIASVGEDTERLIKEAVGAPPEAVAYAEELKVKFGIKK